MHIYIYMAPVRYVDLSSFWQYSLGQTYSRSPVTVGEHAYTDSGMNVIVIITAPPHCFRCLFPDHEHGRRTAP